MYKMLTQLILQHCPRFEKTGCAKCFYHIPVEWVRGGIYCKAGCYIHKNDDIATEDHQRTVDNMPINGSDQQQENVLWSNPGEDSNWENNQPASTSETPDEETPQNTDTIPSTCTPAYR